LEEHLQRPLILVIAALRAESAKHSDDAGTTRD
jgi:hypothetical protein